MPKEAKYEDYQLEGEKENYKEVLVTMPKKYSEKERSDAEDRGIMLPANNEKNVFSSSHFSEPNILVHLRMNTRKDAEGNKVLFLEEVQSDWGQKGKKEGFANIDKLPDGYRIEEPSKFSNWTVVEPSGIDGNIQSTTIGQGETKSEAIQRALDNLNRRKIQTAPFVMDTNAWTKLGLKVALKEAVAQGAERIAWSSGEQQFDRWGSEEIHWQTISKPNGGSIVVKNTDKAPVIRGRKAINLASISKDLDPQKEIERVAEKWGLKPSDLEYKADIGGKWNISVNEQTDNAQAFAGNEEALRQNKLAESELTITSKEQLRESLERNLARERNKQEIDKLTDRIWDRMQKEESGTSMPRREGMKGFYGEPSEGKKGIVGGVAKALVKELTGKPAEIVETKISGKINRGISDNEIFENSKKITKEEAEDLITDKTHGDKWVYVFENGEPFRIRTEGDLAEANLIGQRLYSVEMRGKSTQHSIEITPELRAAVEKGQPLFKESTRDKQQS